MDWKQRYWSSCLPGLHTKRVCKGRVMNAANIVLPFHIPASRSLYTNITAHHMLCNPCFLQLTVSTGVCCQTIGDTGHPIVVAIVAVHSIEGVGSRAEVHALAELDDCTTANRNDQRNRRACALILPLACDTASAQHCQKLKATHSTHQHWLPHLGCAQTR